MNDVSEEELGPIDYMVVEFPAGTSNFSGAMAAELARSPPRRTARIRFRVRAISLLPPCGIAAESSLIIDEY